MTTTLIGMGSNIEPEKYLVSAADILKEAFGEVRFSSVYQSKAVGMDGDDFLNACCLVVHEMSREQLSAWLKAQEDAHGRDRSEGSWKPRTLDLDILMWDGEVLDDDLYRYSHVFIPAQELVSYCMQGNEKGAPLQKLEIVL